MATCPSCQSQIEIGSEYFGGLFTCPQCKAVYFISFDGAPEGPEIPDVPSDVPPLEPYITYEPPRPMEVMSQPVDIQQDIQPSYESIGVSLPQAPFTPLQDVVEFANSEKPQSLLTFTVTIKGLDFSQNLQALRDILTDSKLKLNFEEAKTQIKNGELRLTKLSPAQAAVLVFRLRPLQIEMTWEQNIL